MSGQALAGDPPALGARLLRQSRARFRRPPGTRAGRAVLLAAAALLAGAAGGCSKAAPEQVETSAKVPVTLRLATVGTIRATTTATGAVKPGPGAELTVVAPQSARIAEMPKGTGDRVRKGDLLVRFEIPSLAADAEAKRAEVARAEARLANARASGARIQSLFERGIAARKELEDARRELADSEAGLAEAKSGRLAAGALASRMVVRAPFAGLVAARSQNPGDLVDASTGPVLRVVDPERLQVEAAVPLAAVGQVAVGNPARVFASAGGTGEAATAITRPAAVDSTTGTAAVRLAFVQPTRLPPGTPVRVEIAGPEHLKALLVPASALVQEGTESFVYTVDKQGHAHRRKVEPGASAGGATEILSGIAPGEQVIVAGQEGLPDGAAVTAAPAAPPAAPDAP
jgi:RND family efflux transporter MFP subunit